jgi:hypothetical protein
VALCLIPANVEPGQDVELTQRTFDLLVSEPVEFPLFISSTRLTDKPGELIPVHCEQLTPLPPIRTVLKVGRKKTIHQGKNRHPERSEGSGGNFGEILRSAQDDKFDKTKADVETVPVHLHARLTEIGTLELWCSEVAGRRSWRLQFDVRAATQTDVKAHESDAEREGFIDESLALRCCRLIQNTFGPQATEKPEGLAKRLAAASGGSRNAWPTSFCRRLWEALMEVEPGRRKNAVHEARWLNLLGFCLRPGFGMAVDDWRVAQTWSALQGKFAFASSRAEGWILWRRIAGGLAPGQQQALAEPLLGPIRALHKQLTTGQGRGADLSFASRETVEMWRLLGSLELLPVEVKTELGTLLVELLPKQKIQPVLPAVVWSLGRLGARSPMFGPLNSVIPAETAAAWLSPLVQLARAIPETAVAVMQLARKTGDRYRDLPDKSRRVAEEYLLGVEAPPHFVELLRRPGRLVRSEENLIFGESLPKGLRIT